MITVSYICEVQRVPINQFLSPPFEKSVCGIYIILYSNVPCISAETVGVTPLPGAVSVTVCETLEAVMVVAAVCEPQGAKVVTVAVEEARGGTAVSYHVGNTGS